MSDLDLDLAAMVLVLRQREREARRGLYRELRGITRRAVEIVEESIRRRAAPAPRRRPTTPRQKKVNRG